MAQVQLDAAWTACWARLVVRDLPGYPLWLDALHDVLQDAFASVVPIFIAYSRETVQGSASISGATRVSLQEALALAKDCSLDDAAGSVARQFAAAASSAASVIWYEKQAG